MHHMRGLECRVLLVYDRHELDEHLSARLCTGYDGERSIARCIHDAPGMSREDRVQSVDVSLLQTPTSLIAELLKVLCRTYDIRENQSEITAEPAAQKGAQVILHANDLCQRHRLEGVVHGVSVHVAPCTHLTRSVRDAHLWETSGVPPHRRYSRVVSDHSQYPKPVRWTGPFGRLPISVARTAGRVARLWNQKGLGTLYSRLRRLPLVGKATCVVELAPETRFEFTTLDPYWAPTALAGRPYEPELHHILARVAHLDPVFVDGGANFGFWSCWASGPVYALSTTIAVEPNPTSYAQLERNRDLNGRRFECVRSALSDKPGVARFGHADRHAVARIVESGPGFDVPVTTVDAILEERSLLNRPMLIKLDVEGHELEAISGSNNACRRGAAFVVEDFLKRDDCAIVRALLHDGWSVFYVCPDGTCERLFNIEGVRQALTRVGKEKRSNNFVVLPDTGQMHALFDSWARRRVLPRERTPQQ
jgi:FkbM family methyltransferase